MRELGWRSARVFALYLTASFLLLNTRTDNAETDIHPRIDPTGGCFFNCFFMCWVSKRSPQTTAIAEICQRRRCLI